MHHFEFLPHTADIRMLIEASTLEELFHTALEGMNAILHASDKEPGSSSKHEYRIHLTSPDITTLLIDFLSDVLTEGYEKKTIFNSLRIDQLKDASLHAILHGYFVDQFDEDIKAVTYHEAEVRMNDAGNWQTVVIFDV
ncbi:MAG TPA: archease [Saprospiraceae bacterium]|nr:archease [Saprospiraceae bacterium]